MWYFAENGQQQGPVPLADLQAMIRAGRLTIDSLVWRQGMNNWMPVQNVPELRLEADLAKRGKVGAASPGASSPRPLQAPPIGVPVPGASPDGAGAPDEGPGMSSTAQPFSSGAGAGAGSEPPPAAAERPSVFGPAVDFPDDSTPRPLRPLASAAGAGHCVKCGAPLSTGHAGVGSDAGQGLCDTCRAAFAASLTPGAAGGAGMASTSGSPMTYCQYGGFLARFVASFCDGLILWVMSFAVTFVLSFGFALVGSALHHEFGEVLEVLALLASSLLGGILLPSLYHGYFLSSQGATPGKKLLGLAVVRPDGSTVSFLRGMCRFWATSISGMICGIGYLMALFDDEKRALHDHICDTRVVSSR